MATMVALSSFAGAAVVGRFAVRSPSALRRRALVVRAQAEVSLFLSRLCHLNFFSYSLRFII
jgi:hypothetical protein